MPITAVKTISDTTRGLHRRSSCAHCKAAGVPFGRSCSRSGDVAGIAPTRTSQELHVGSLGAAITCRFAFLRWMFELAKEFARLIRIDSSRPAANAFFTKEGRNAHDSAGRREYHSFIQHLPKLRKPEDRRYRDEPVMAATGCEVPAGAYLSACGCHDPRPSDQVALGRDPPGAFRSEHAVERGVIPSVAETAPASSE